MAYWGPDPECGRPPELEGLSADELDALCIPADPPLAFPGDYLPRDGSGNGTGFADGGVLDVLPPGVVLAGFADEAHTRLTEISDDELIGVLRAWRRQASWAQAREFAVIAELARRRPGWACPPAPPGEVPLRISEFIGDEVAAALTLTSLAAQHHLDLALSLARYKGTAAALEAGQIDMPRVRVIVDGLAPLTEEHAAAVETAVLPKAPVMTTGQLRAAVARAVLAADPEAALRAREEAQKDARVECGIDAAGTASLAGRSLPPAEALAADQRVSGVAIWWKKQGAVAGMDLLRARAFLALLLGLDVTAPPADLLPPPAGQGPQSPEGDGQGGTANPAGLRRTTAGADAAGTGTLPPLAGSVNLTLPLATLLGWSQAPGEASRYGPLDASTARHIAFAAAGSPSTGWHLTVTDADGRAVAHGCAARRRGPGQNWRFILETEPIARDECGHRNAEPGYRPSPRLAHLVQVRTTRCCYPGCRRPAARCDDDHTIPHDQDGLTCECNLSPLCRFHHRLKQSEGWALAQVKPGVMMWKTPANRRHTTQPTAYPG